MRTSVSDKAQQKKWGGGERSGGADEKQKYVSVKAH